MWQTYAKLVLHTTQDRIGKFFTFISEKRKALTVFQVFIHIWCITEPRTVKLLILLIRESNKTYTINMT